MSANLRGSSGADLSAMHQSMLQGYSLHSLQQPKSTSFAAPARSTAPEDDLAAMLSRFESSSVSSALSAGSAPLSSLNEFSDFDSRALRMVDELADDEEEVAAAKSAASAWGPPTASATNAYGFNQAAYAPMPSTPLKSHIPAPGASPAQLPPPQNTPAKGAVSLADLERQLKVAGATSSPTMVSQPAPGSGLPPALQQLAAAQQQPTPTITYSGPPLPLFQHGSPAPQGLSVDDHERQHFYIPLPRSNHGLGFMTKSEIALVFRIQLSQLQSIGDPLSDDFYSQVIQARKGGKVNSSGQAILPVFKSGQARNEDGSPKLPEGTLGRISAFSIHKPKRLMAIGDASSSSADEPIADDQPRKSNMFSARTLSYLIEEGYRCLMDLEDVDALLASLAPQQFEDPMRAYDRQRLVSQRAELCTRLLESLDLDEIHLRMHEVANGDHLIFKFYALPKGRLLIYRSLVLLNPPNTYQLVDVLMHDLTQIAMPSVPAPSTDEKLTFLLSDLIYSMPLLPYANEIFSYFLTAKHAPRLVELVRTNMLCQFLQVLFKKGHEATMVLQQNAHIAPQGGMPGIHETVQQWRAIFDGITNAIEGQIAAIFDGLPKDAKPVLPPTASQLAAKARREKEEKKAAAAAAASGEKKEEKKPVSPVADADATKEAPVSPFLSTRFGMWELMAAFFSHANPAQHAWLDAELRSVLIKEVESLYGEYRERKEKQAAAVAAAQAEKEKAEAEKPAEAAADATVDAAPTDDKKADAASAPAAAAPSGRRAPSSVPPASSLPPPPSPALRFLASALLGDASPEFGAIARTWSDLHNDYMYYQMKHQQKVQQEQSRLAHQQQMRAQRQQQQRRQWQQYQGQQQQQQQQPPRGPPGSSPTRPPHQHQHFHAQPQQFQGGRSGGQQRGGQRGGPQQSPQRAQQQQQPPPPEQPAGPPQPVPVWVKAGTTGATAVKTPVKQPAPASK